MCYSIFSTLAYRAGAIEFRQVRFASNMRPSPFIRREVESRVGTSSAFMRRSRLERFSLIWDAVGHIVVSPLQKVRKIWMRTLETAKYLDMVDASRGK